MSKKGQVSVRQNKSGSENQRTNKLTARKAKLLAKAARKAVREKANVEQFLRGNLDQKF